MLKGPQRPNNFINGQTEGITIWLEPINGNKNPAVQVRHLRIIYWRPAAD